MAKASVGKFCFAAAVVALLVFRTKGAPQTTVTQILVQNGLPKGLLPATVKSYTLAENGHFQVNLRSTCTTQYGGKDVYYKKTITGELSYGKIDNLGGIQVHQLFFWLSVTSIQVDNVVPNTLWFKAGYFSAALSTDLFQEDPVCNSLSEEDGGGEPKDAMSFLEWLSKALSGTLEVNVPHIPDTGAARKLLQ